MAGEIDIASAANERFRRLLDLAGSARERKRQGLSVIEGTHLVQAWLERFGDQAGGAQVFVSRRGLASDEVRALVGRFPAPPTVLDERLYARASQVEHGSGPLAIVPTPRPAMPPRVDDDAVYLDRIQDPGNVGSILRTCAAVGVRRVLTSPGTAFCWSPKVLRAGMGAGFALRLRERLREDEILALSLPLVGTSPHADELLPQAALPQPLAWLLGHEGQGASPRLLASCATTVRIPQPGGEESLNVAAAAAICFYEALRRRG